MSMMPKGLDSLFKTVENTERDGWERTWAILHYGKLSLATWF